MLKNGSKAAPSKTRVEVLTIDPEFERSMRDTFAMGGKIDLSLVNGMISACEESLGGEGVTVVVVDIDSGDEKEMAALERLASRLAGWPPLVVVMPSFDKDLARRLVQMRVADFLVKPVPPIELVRTCARVVQAPKSADQAEAEIYTYIPAIGGAGRHHTGDPDRAAVARQRRPEGTSSHVPGRPRLPAGRVCALP